MASRKEQIEAMLAKTPDDAFLRYGLAMEYLREGNVDEGIRRLKGVIEHDPHYHAAYFQLGQRLMQNGDTDDAAHWLRTGITVAQKLGNSHAAGEMEQLLRTLP